MTGHGAKAELGAKAQLIDAPASDAIRARRFRVVLAATVGNTLEWYDFLVYALLAVTIAKLFFPAGSELNSLLLSMATFGIGLVTRPVGAVVLGMYADRVGRKAARSLAIFIMALGTGLIAIAPTYEAIGIWAPLLIVFARLLQGFSCGGELGGAIALLVENAPERRRGLHASWQAASQSAGFLLGAVVTVTVTLTMTPAQIESGGWRLPFVFGLLIAPVGLYIRSQLQEPELFLKVREAARSAAMTDTLRQEGRPAFLALGVSVLYVVSAYVLFVYMPTFAVRQLQLSFSSALLAPVAAACLNLQLGFAVLMAMYGGPVVAVLAELFSTRVRSTAIAVAYNLVAMVGGFAPFVVTWLIATTGNPRAPAFYVIGAAVISGCALFWLRDRYREPLR